MLMYFPFSYVPSIYVSHFYMFFHVRHLCHVCLISSVSCVYVLLKFLVIHIFISQVSKFMCSSISHILIFQFSSVLMFFSFPCILCVCISCAMSSSVYVHAFMLLLYSNIFSTSHFPVFHVFMNLCFSHVNILHQFQCSCVPCVSYVTLFHMEMRQCIDKMS